MRPMDSSISQCNLMNVNNNKVIDTVYSPDYNECNKWLIVRALNLNIHIGEVKGKDNNKINNMIKDEINQRANGWDV